MTILQFFSKNILDLSPFCPPFCETPKNPDFQNSRPTTEKSKSRIKNPRTFQGGGVSRCFTRNKKKNRAISFTINFLETDLPWYGLTHI